MQRYNPKEIEPKWQQKWAEEGTYAVDFHDTTKPKYYGFAMLPYPSGTGLHTGHVRTYTLADVTVRAKRQQGYNAYNPIGWDAFGLPAENYAIKTGTSPQETIKKATDRFRQQLTRLGMSHDWSKEINTSEPGYYRWTQWVFLQLFESGLAYQKESAQWWCPVDLTVLANEQVEAGKCWRCGSRVEKKLLMQWFFKITDYADELLNSADDLDWPNFIKVMQRNWIGRSKGAEITFQIAAQNDDNGNNCDDLTVFTTRPDTLYGVSFMVLAPEHPLAQIITSDEQRSLVQDYIVRTQAKTDIQRQETDREKTGVFTGTYAINPINDKKIPIWIADYVLPNYGTGAIMAVPAHDERDFAFAQKFDLPVIDVVEPETGTPQQNPEARRSIVAIVRNPKTNEYLTVDWAKQGGYLYIGGGRDEGEDIVETANREVAEETGYKNLRLVSQTGRITHHYYAHSKNVARKIEAYGLLFELTDETRGEQSLEANEKGKFTVQWLTAVQAERQVVEELHATCYRLLVKGERYHGEGIMAASGAYTGMSSSMAREKIVADLESESQGRAVTNYKIRDWLISRQRYWGAPIPIIHCPIDGAVAVPEDQLPLELPLVENYQPDGGHTSVLAGVEDWVNTICPKCGGPAKRETDTMDGYACSSWYFLRYLDPHNQDQAWDPAIINRWMPVDFYNGADHAVSHLLYARFWTHFFHKIGLIADPEPFKRLVYNAYILAPDGTKMSKSKGNVVDPLEIIDSGYGADALRIYEMFIAPYDLEAPWDTRGVPGCYRFLQRAWNLTQYFLDSQSDSSPQSSSAGEAMEVGQYAQIIAREVLQTAHKTVKKVTEDIEATKFNTAIAAMMEAVNAYMKLKEKAGVQAMDHSPEWQYAIESLIMMIAPFAPHIADELWQQLGNDSTVHTDNWPKYDKDLLRHDTTVVVVQINGKFRASLEMPRVITELEAVAAARADNNVAKYLEHKKISRTIYIAGKIVNFVVQ